MVKEKILIAVRPSDSLTAADKAMAEEKRETDKMTLPPTAAELANIRKTLGAQKTALDQRSDIVGLVRICILEEQCLLDAIDCVIIPLSDITCFLFLDFYRNVQ